MNITKLSEDSRIKNASVLDLGDRQGYSGYIDFIQLEEMGDNPVMQGTDQFGRKFICFQVVEQGLDWESEDFCVREKKRVSVLFQRYEDRPDFWATAMTETVGWGAVRPEMVQRAYRLLDGEKLSDPEGDVWCWLYKST